MTSLYRSKDPFVCRLLREVEGQLRTYNADHPEAAISDKAIRSIAKQVVGQIASSWAQLSEVRAIAGVPTSEAAVGSLSSPPLAAGVRVVPRSGCRAKEGLS